MKNQQLNGYAKINLNVLNSFKRPLSLSILWCSTSENRAIVMRHQILSKLSFNSTVLFLSLNFRKEIAQNYENHDLFAFGRAH